MKNLIPLSLLLALAPLAHGQSLLSVNFTNAASDLHTIEPTEFYGIEITDQWQNVGIGSFTDIGGTGIDLTSGGQGNFLNNIFGPTFGQNTVFLSGISRASWMNFPGSEATFDLANMNTAAPGGYYVIVYTSGYSETLSVPHTATGFSTVYSAPSYDPFNFTEIVSTDSGNPTGSGNYVQYGSVANPLTTDTFSFELGTPPASNSQLSGFQVIAVPEPSTYAAILGLIALGLLISRRRR
jgi:hypothetical protein